MASPAPVQACVKCAHYQVSWDPAMPHRCIQFGIKSRDLPSVAVFRSTGHPCPSWQKNPRIRESNP